MNGIKIEAEFTMKTFAGFYTYCKADEHIWDDFRDVENVEKAVAYVKKILTNKNARDIMVTFIYDNGTDYGCSTSRLCDDFSGGIREYAWDEYGNNIRNIQHKKLSAKHIKELYLDCADKAIEYKKERGIA